MGSLWVPLSPGRLHCEGAAGLWESGHNDPVTGPQMQEDSRFQCQYWSGEGEGSWLVTSWTVQPRIVKIGSKTQGDSDLLKVKLPVGG